MCVCAHASLARALRRKEGRTSRKYRHRATLVWVVGRRAHRCIGRENWKGLSRHQDHIHLIQHAKPLGPYFLGRCLLLHATAHITLQQRSLLASNFRTDYRADWKKKERETNLLDGQRNDLAALAGPPNHGSAWGPCARPLRWIESVRELPPLSRFELRGEEEYSSTASGAAELAKNYVCFRFFGGEIPRRPAVSISFATRTRLFIRRPSEEHAE